MSAVRPRLLVVARRLELDQGLGVAEPILLATPHRKPAKRRRSDSPPSPASRIQPGRAVSE